jgi:hypothetical protein
MPALRTAPYAVSVRSSGIALLAQSGLVLLAVSLLLAAPADARRAGRRAQAAHPHRILILS